jgi:allantoin racemase
MRLWYQLISSEAGMNHFLAACQSVLERAKAPGTTVEVHGTRHGALADQYRLFMNYDVREVIDLGLRIRREGGYDAFVLANSFDPGLVELREMLDIPVVSFMEVACFSACMMGERFSVIGPNRKFIPRYREIVHGYGLRERLASVEGIEFDDIRSFNDAFADRAAGDRALEQIMAAIRRAIAAGAEVVIPAGPAAVLLATRGCFELEGVPLLDVNSLLVKTAETMVEMKRLTGTHISRRLLYQAPSEELVRQVAEVRGIDLLKRGH